MLRHTLPSAIAAIAMIGAAGVASAQPAPASGQAASHRGDMHARMEAERTQRMQNLHTVLRLKPGQEDAWRTFMNDTTMSRSEYGDPREQMQAMQSMTTPQRLDMMVQHMDQHAQAFRKRADATKAFYAQLTPEQQKVFDASMGLQHEGRHSHGHGHMGRHGK